MRLTGRGSLYTHNGEDDPYPLPFSNPPREQGDFTDSESEKQDILKPRILESPNGQVAEQGNLLATPCL